MLNEATAKQLDEHQTAKARLLEDHKLLTARMVVAIAETDDGDGDGLAAFSANDRSNLLDQVQRIFTNAENMRGLNKTIRVLSQS